MPDVHSPEARSRNMAAIRGTNTKPEILIRKALFRQGFRYRIHDKKLPGKPDIVLPKYKAVIFVHGCFWHGHNCSLFKVPKTRTDFWLTKIQSNRERDTRNQAALAELGWRIGVVWECSTKGPLKLSIDYIGCLISEWLKSNTERMNIGERSEK